MATKTTHFNANISAVNQITMPDPDGPGTLVIDAAPTQMGFQDDATVLRVPLSNVSGPMAFTSGPCVVTITQTTP